MTDQGYKGQKKPTSATSKFNEVHFLVSQILAECNTTTLVKIVGCTNSGGLYPVGFVDVQPLVNLVDGYGNAKEHGVVYHCLYLRVQGGANAIIIDPEPGDIGMCSFADRDISSVKKNKRASNPGSGRKFDFSDGIYLGGMLNGVPSQYVRFHSGEVDVVSPGAVNITAPSIVLTGNTQVIGTLTNNTVNIGSTHAHSNIEPGSGNSGGPF